MPVRAAEEVGIVRALLREYAAALDIDLAAQSFEDEIASLPKYFSPPRGDLLLALGENGEAQGCVAMRSLEGTRVCEIKRLYVRPNYRGERIGARLLSEILERAARCGYEEIKLDTLPTMSQALSLYRSFGIEQIEPYGNAIYDGLICLGRKLALKPRTNDL